MSPDLTPGEVAPTPPNVISLRELIAQRQRTGERFHLAEVVAIVVPICTDLARRHARRETIYVHPSSIAAGLDGTPRLIAELARHKPTDAPDVAALAPELADGAPNSRSSVFGIAAVVYEMLTLRPIGPGMKPPSALLPGIPQVVDTILAKALVTDSRQRPDDLAAFAQAIHHFAPESIMPPPEVDEHAFEVDVDLRTSMIPTPPTPMHAVRLVSLHPFTPIADTRPSARDAERVSQNSAVDELAALKARLEADSNPRWIVVKDQMDHGPFAAIELLHQLANDTFIEDHLLVDTHTGKQQAIKDHPGFSRFAHHAARKREEVHEAKQVVLLEKKEKTAGHAKGTLGIIAIVTVLGLVGFVVYKIRGKAAEERRRQEEESQTIAGEGTIGGKAREKARVVRGAGGGGAGGGLGYDEALRNTVSDYDSDTLTTKECAAPVGGGIAAACGLSGSARAQIVVKSGRAVGVTVTTDPAQPAVNSCMASAIRGLSWRSVAGATGCIRTFKAN